MADKKASARKERTPARRPHHTPRTAAQTARRHADIELEWHLESVIQYATD